MSIATDKGSVPAEDLEVGDLVLTVVAGYQPIRWIGKRSIDAAQLAANPKLHPIRIQRGALGHGLPERDMVLSPQHRVLVRGKVAEKMFCSTEVLVAAKQLVPIDGIGIADDVTQIIHVHFLLDDHRIVLAEGAHLESLYTGPEALKSMPPEQREEVLELFPDMAALDEANLLFSARPLVPGRKARIMVMRPRKNGKALVEEL